ncbi:hypothetical protein [Bradyrhizobium canariense]|uniref:hypothetical protein n=1 Tax=Bradyrhizobium canariense TaxID=255045 RepID=UPI001CA4F6A9|nr:hypothetical protein [Bradyrhizobium canariense]
MTYRTSFRRLANIIDKVREGTNPGDIPFYRRRGMCACTLVNAIPGLSCMAPDGAFYLYVNCGGLIGKTTPDGKRLDADGDVVLYFLDSAGVALVAERPMDFRPTSGFRSPPILKH